MARFVLLLFYLVVIVCHVTLAIETVTLNTKLGKLKGSLIENENGRDYYGFTGIPFAKPPVGELRFKPPQPADSWGAKEFDATKEGSECPQGNFMNGDLAGDEDCLVLNIFAPYNKIESKLPVLVSIHGGGYVSGSGRGDFLGPGKFMEHDIIFVTIQYRLGLLGFLNTEDTEATGNYGMLDQVMALRWIRENIEDFGGDKRQITIFGVSAGGSSVSYHMLSPLSKGLFDGAIAQSGSTLARWAFQRNPLEWAQKLASAIDCPTDTTKNMVDCFKRKPVSELVKGNRELHITNMLPFHAAPSVDTFGEQVFLPDDPLTLLKEGKVNSVPFIAGRTAEEGYLFYIDMKRHIENKHEEFFDQHAGTYFPAILEAEPHMSAVYQRIREEFFNGKDVNDPETFEATMTKVIGHIMFDVGIAQTIDFLHKAGVPVRSYIFNHIINASFIGFMGGEPGKYVSHGEDGFIQYASSMTKHLKESDEDKIMTKVFNTIWVNFAAGRYDNLVTLDNEELKWPLYTEQRPQYLELTIRPKIKDGKICDKIDFWTKTIPEMIKDYGQKDEL